MAKKTSALPLASWATAVGATVEEAKAAWEDLVRRGLASVHGGMRTVSPFALRRANSQVQRRLAAHLSGFALTENSFIVRRMGEPQSCPSILNSRIAVGHIAHYFKDGCGVTDIQRDLPQLTREEIEAAIQYYLNHREEIEEDLQRSRKIYETHSVKQESVTPEELADLPGKPASWQENWNAPGMEAYDDYEARRRDSVRHSSAL